MSPLLSINAFIIRVPPREADSAQARLLGGVTDAEHPELAAELKCVLTCCRLLTCCRSIVSFSVLGRPRQKVVELDTGEGRRSIGTDFDMEATLKLGQVIAALPLSLCCAAPRSLLRVLPRLCFPLGPPPVLRSRVLPAARSPTLSVLRSRWGCGCGWPSLALWPPSLG